MPSLEILPIVAAAIAAFVISTVWYSTIARGALTPADGSVPPEAAAGSPPPWKIAAELARSAIVAAVVGAIAALIGVTDAVGAVGLAAALWLAFPAVLLAGSVMWEGVSVGRAAAHAGDWLVKLIAVTLIVTLWP